MKESNNVGLFNPNLNVNTKDLKKIGFVEAIPPYENVPGLFSIKNDSLYILHQVNRDYDIINGEWCFKKIKDSISVVDFVTENNGIVSRFWQKSYFEDELISQHFFVQGIYSGMIFLCMLKDDGFYVFIDYPNNNVSPDSRIIYIFNKKYDDDHYYMPPLN